ncbi:MAG: L-threonylcarbamoyladenylate synthase [Pseudomonadota bacterium]
MTGTDLIPATDAGIARCAALLRTGQLVAFPTETVYGLGADATNEEAVRAIYAAKGRPDFNPLIVHVPDAWAAEQLIDLPRAGLALAKAAWPGPLTMVAPMREGAGIAPSVTAGLATLAVRVPGHRLAKELLMAAQRPLAAPSANPSGRISPTMPAHVLDGLNGRIAAVLNGGPCPVGLESTIVGFDRGAPVLLRPGGLPVEDIVKLMGGPILDRDGTEITAPGQLASHYAPVATLRLNADAPDEGELWLGFGDGPAGANLSRAGDLKEAAASLFQLLRDLDEQAEPDQRIAVARIPKIGLGLAINDRLMRAAAPRGKSGQEGQG